eukprot:COSAG02_NODE_262_length_26647_cov_21.607240_14_plen_49_part_00
MDQQASPTSFCLASTACPALQLSTLTISVQNGILYYLKVLQYTSFGRQ